MRVYLLFKTWRWPALDQERVKHCGVYSSAENAMASSGVSSWPQHEDLDPGVWESDVELTPNGAYVFSQIHEYILDDPRWIPSTPQ